MKECQKQFFNQIAETWNVPIQNIMIAEEVINRLGIQAKHSILDVGCGTGILYNLLLESNVQYYVGIDISEKMLAKFKEKFSQVNLMCYDFENGLEKIQGKFDYCIIFNSIPHFNNLHKVFQNAYNSLKDEGKFVIVHCRTREGLKQHHINIGYSASKQHPIPLDTELIDECMEVGFKEVIVEDEKYFYFEATKI